MVTVIKVGTEVVLKGQLETLVLSTVDDSRRVEGPEGSFESLVLMGGRRRCLLRTESRHPLSGFRCTVSVILRSVLDTTGVSDIGVEACPSRRGDH